MDFPWEAPQPGPSFFDLKRNPELVAALPEATQFPEMAAHLAFVNSPLLTLQSSKCDVWYTRSLAPEDEIFALSVKFGSYVDLVFADPERQTSFEAHQSLAKKLSELLKKVPDIPCSVEVIVRRCWFGDLEGFYFTVYCFGFGTDENSSRCQWAISLRLVENAISQAERAG